MAREQGNQHIEGLAPGIQTSTLHMVGRSADAIAPGLEYLALSRETHDVRALSYALFTLGLCYAYIGKYSLAIKYSGELLQLAQQNNDEWTIGSAYDTICASLTAIHRYQEAKQAADRAEERLRQVNYRNALYYLLNTQGLVQLGIGQILAARRCFQQELDAAHAEGYSRAEALIRYNLAYSYRLETDYATARRYVDESLGLFKRIKSFDTPAAAILLEVLGDAQRGDRAAQLRHLLELALASATNPDLYSCSSLAEESRALSRQLNDEQVAQAADQFIAEFFARDTVD